MVAESVCPVRLPSSRPLYAEWSVTSRIVSGRSRNANLTPLPGSGSAFTTAKPPSAVKAPSCHLPASDGYAEWDANAVDEARTSVATSAQKSVDTLRLGDRAADSRCMSISFRGGSASGAIDTAGSSASLDQRRPAVNRSEPTSTATRPGGADAVRRKRIGGAVAKAGERRRRTLYAAGARSELRTRDELPGGDPTPAFRLWQTRPAHRSG